jgi:hypothetical protein
MSKTGTYTLSFRKSLERYYGNAPYVLIVEYSTNSGSSWTKLGTSPDANGTNWYGNTGVSTALQSDGIGFLADITNEATSYNISSLGGNSDVRFRFTYISNGGFSTIGFEDGFMIDDFAISTTQVNSPNAFDVATALNSTATAYLGANDTVNFITSGCEIIATVYNLSSHDYGMTTVTVDAAGTGTKDFSTNTATSREICDKTILITPTTNNTSGSVKIQTYFSSTEASNWKTATGISYIDMNQIKSVGAIDTATVSNTVYAVSPVIDSAYAGNNLSIVGTYSNGFSGLGAGGDGTTGPLPLDLLNFDGKWENKFAKLYWTTANEVNVKQFDVERLDGEQFVYVGTVAAAGFSAEKQDYELIDYSTDIVARKTVHYRLKMTDFDGKYKYSKVVILRNTSSEVVVHPNPATNFFNVVFNSRSIEPIAIEIVNASGQLVYSQNNITETSRIDVSQLTNGIYFVAIKRDGNVVEVEKLNILH